MPGVYVTCNYDSHSYIGIIIEKSIENYDVYIKFMKKSEIMYPLARK